MSRHKSYETFLPSRQWRKIKMKPSSTYKVTMPRILIYGDHKIGKSTFASDMPSPIFIQTEDGLSDIETEAFPLCESLVDVHAQLDWLIEQDHAYKSLCVDSLDWTEKLIWAHICKENGWEQIGDGAYGAGYKLSKNEWAKILDKLQFLNTEKRMLICLISHAKISKFEDPERENYDRWDLDLYEKSAKLICQWVDIIGFAAQKIAVSKKKGDFNADVTKAKSTGERVLNLSKNPAYEAGNRFSLPDEISLSWDVLATELKHHFASRKKGNLEAKVKESKESKRRKIENLIEKDNENGEINAS